MPYFHILPLLYRHSSHYYIDNKLYKLFQFSTEGGFFSQIGNLIHCHITIFSLSTESLEQQNANLRSCFRSVQPWPWVSCRLYSDLSSIRWWEWQQGPPHSLLWRSNMYTEVKGWDWCMGPSNSDFRNLLGYIKKILSIYLEVAVKTHKALASGPLPLAPDDSKQCFSPFSLQGPSYLRRNGHGPLSEKCISN